MITYLIYKYLPERKIVQHLNKTRINGTRVISPSHLCTVRVHDTEDHAVLQELRGPVEAVIAPLPAVQVVTQTIAEIILAQLMGLTVQRKLPIFYPSL